MAECYRPGDHWVQCDKTGFKVRASQTRVEWNGLRVRSKSFEERHPQDLIRSFKDDQSVQDPRPESPDSFLSPNEAHNALLDPDRGSVTAVATPDGGNTGDGSVTALTADLSADTSGNYTVRITEVTRAGADDQDPGDNGEFIVTDPNGDFVGFGEMGVQFTGGGLCFTVKEDGSTAFAVDDFFTIAVS